MPGRHVRGGLNLLFRPHLIDDQDIGYVDLDSPTRTTFSIDVLLAAANSTAHPFTLNSSW